jgi:hypothetical protein
MLHQTSQLSEHRMYMTHPTPNLTDSYRENTCIGNSVHHRCYTKHCTTQDSLIHVNNIALAYGRKPRHPALPTCMSLPCNITLYQYSVLLLSGVHYQQTLTELAICSQTIIPLYMAVDHLVHCGNYHVLLCTICFTYILPIQ